MRALGELLTYRPIAGSFATYADEFCGPFDGFVTGWSYWFMWIVTAMAELTAIGIYVQHWFPTLPQWVPALVALVVLYGSNLLAVRVFGELEFWFALIKVVTIVGAHRRRPGRHLLPRRQSRCDGRLLQPVDAPGVSCRSALLGVLLTLQMVMFAYQGVELIGVTAGEAENPEVVLPKATNGITYRILIFYIGALLVIMSLVPWDQLSPGREPVRLSVRQDRAARGRRHHQPRGHHRGHLLVQQRIFQHRPDVVFARAAAAGAGAVWPR